MMGSDEILQEYLHSAPPCGELIPSEQGFGILFKRIKTLFLSWSHVRDSLPAQTKRFHLDFLYEQIVQMYKMLFLHPSYFKCFFFPTHKPG